MEAIKAKLAERAELAKRLAELDANILEQYSILANSPKLLPLDCDSKFIVKARNDCKKLLYNLRGVPHRFLKMLLESPFGIIDYDDTVSLIWGVDPCDRVHRTQTYMRELFKKYKLPYHISAYKHGAIRLLPK